MTDCDSDHHCNYKYISYNDTFLYIYIHIDIQKILFVHLIFDFNENLNFVSYQASDSFLWTKCTGTPCFEIEDSNQMVDHVFRKTALHGGASVILFFSMHLISIIIFLSIIASGSALHRPRWFKRERCSSSTCSTGTIDIDNPCFFSSSIFMIFSHY